LLLSLISYHTQDPSWNTATSARPLNLIGYPGSYVSDLLYQVFGLGAFVFPFFGFLLAWRWMRSEVIEAEPVKVAGTILLLLSLCAAISFGPPWLLFGGAVRAGGTLGLVLVAHLVEALNLVGALVLTFTILVVSVYLISTFTFSKLGEWVAGPVSLFRQARERWARRRAELRLRKLEEAQERARRRIKKKQTAGPPEPQLPEREAEAAPAVVPLSDAPPWEVPEPLEPEVAEAPADEEIPICPLEEPAAPVPVWKEQEPPERPHEHPVYRVPSTALLNEPPGRNPYDEQELKDIAAKIKSKFEEFNVLGSVVQINPGPVVTTFEFKPEAGI